MKAEWMGSSGDMKKVVVNGDFVLGAFYIQIEEKIE